MSFWESAGGSSLISAGADIISGAFGGDGESRAKRMAREQYKYQHRYGPWVQDAMVRGNIKSRVAGAKAAGIHPLVAMGVPASGGSPAIPIQGQSGGGASASVADAVSKHFSRMSELAAQKELVEAQAEASRARALENSSEVTNEKVPDLIEKLKDQGSAVTTEEEAHKSVGLVKVEPNIQRSRSGSDSSRAAGSNPAWMQVELWPGAFVDVPWSEEGFAESIDSLPALAATVARNAGIGYYKAYRLLRQKLEEYHGRPGRGAAGAPSKASAVPRPKRKYIAQRKPIVRKYRQ